MLPNNQHNFTPMIHNITHKTTQINIKQNKYNIYQTTIPPNPFTINNINSTTNNNNLQITIKKTNNNIQTLYIPYSSIPILQHTKYTHYTLTIKKYHNKNNLQNSPKFIQNNLIHNLKKN